MGKHDKGIEAAGYAIANKGVIAEVWDRPKRCGFFSCKSPIRSGELHVTMHGRRGRPPESMHLGCASRRCWLRPTKAIANLKAAGGMWEKVVAGEINLPSRSC